MEQVVKDNIKQLIVKGKTKEAIEQLRAIFPASGTQKLLSIIESQFISIRKKEISGTLNHQEIQITKNQINDRLLAILYEEPQSISGNSTIGLLKFLIPIFLVISGALTCWMLQPTTYECPRFSEKINNRILIVPFIKITGEDAKPHTSLRDRINELILKKDLSSEAMIGTPDESITPRNAAELTTFCNSDLLVWGTYSAQSDSIRMFLNYYFSHQPESNVFGEKVALSDITELQSGKMNKTLDDAILSLCGIIALRDGHQEIAKNWFEKVKEKENLEQKTLKYLE